MRDARPIASLSLDLDNKWSYLKTHGDPGWDSWPCYLNTVVPRILTVLASRGMKITVFIVGQDAALDDRRAALESIALAGHEIGNHSFRHEPWLHRYADDEVAEEIERAEQHILRATGVKPLGFRGPGYSLSRAVIRVLVRRGYLYDASTFPSFVGPLARAYYSMTGRFSAEQKAERGLLFGTFRDGLRPQKPYRWRVEEGTLLEFPVTTLPFLKLPIHFTYLLYVGRRSPALAKAYLRLALGLCRFTGTHPSLLLHPTDFLGCEDEPALVFFPGMGPRAAKLRLLNELLDIIAASFEISSLGRQAERLLDDPLPLAHLQPTCSHEALMAHVVR